MQRIWHAAIAAVLLLTISAFAEQKTEYGKKSEMRGAKVVFLDTGTNLDFRENAVKVLERELPELSVSDRLDDKIDLILQFRIDSSGDRKGSATMMVLARPTAPGSVRILAKYEDTKSSVWTSKLSTVLIRRFARDYLEANPRQARAAK
jgi:hypothetical protein